MSSRPDSIMDGLVNRDDIDDDRPGSEHTFASETNTWDTDLEIDGNFGFDFRSISYRMLFNTFILKFDVSHLHEAFLEPIAR